MGYVIVFAIAVTVGVLVYRLTGTGQIAPGSAEPTSEDVHQWAGEVVNDPSTSAGGGFGPTTLQVSPETTIPVVAAKRSWHSRLSGALGLVIAIGFGAVAIALTLYFAGVLVGRLVSAGVG